MSLLRRISPLRAAHLFAVANIAFLGLDIVVAHKANDFADRVEWAPIVFSAIATPLMIPGALGSERRVFSILDRVIAWCAIFIGAAGMVFHLESAFFQRQTLHDLVYSAPFVAPLAYVGVGLLLLLVRSKEAETPEFGPWVLFLALGGFIGNFALSLLDHAQNGFFYVTEWIPVVAAAFGVSFLAVAIVKPDRALLRACAWVMGLEVLVGLAGFVLHVRADYARESAPLLERFIFGAPAFAPLLFPNIALLAAIGLWATSARAPEAAAREA